MAFNFVLLKLILRFFRQNLLELVKSYCKTKYPNVDRKRAISGWFFLKPINFKREEKKRYDLTSYRKSQYSLTFGPNMENWTWGTKLNSKFKRNKMGIKLNFINNLKWLYFFGRKKPHKHFVLFNVIVLRASSYTFYI